MGWLGVAMRSVIPTILRFRPTRSVSRPSTGLSWPRGSKPAIRRKPSCVWRKTAATTWLVAMGHTGHSSVWGTFMGTTAEKVTRQVTCSVLVVR
jgi:Universal stress protein family